ncbi:TetR/AcrR family transcriptional regulator [Glycomyces algeriensis]|uniref:TetR family transcriptional regulator n=1 Tax=Glycomyces algeriensis TaxID=256037 RepID=A0A9W6GBS2_9ACTN|nr:TetR/AcrR family transcriptional regulator [Glycomyces algeriensis]MDA1365603.1 TetR/AcrR family transcriptional regulator [Glycomyces algeriensis]MDR7351291.1 AcrR family transcriptional regulator [Glycomyces algeriensis]GLI44006.1 TetR family transcriptional regulator [Glycomyces algeriensis]
MPTGVPMGDARQRLFDAADRLLLQGGPSALTSRAVTDEAGTAKGVLHRHFADFDDFLAEFVLDRAHRMDERAAALRESAGGGTVVDNLTETLSALFGSVAVGIVALVTFRDGLRSRLRETWPAGVPVLTDAVEMIADYLAAERELGRLAPDAVPEGLAPMLVGTAHLLFADRTGAPPTREALRNAVASVVGGAMAERPQASGNS